MKNSPHKVNPQEWRRRNKKYQTRSLAVELARIASAGELYGVKDKIVRAAYERFFDLVDATICDPKWKKSALMLFALRDAAAAGYAGSENPAAVANAFHLLLSDLAENLPAHI